jgi:uncharacterized protein
MQSKREAPTERVRVRRLPERGAYDFEVVAGILDAALVAHVGFSEGGQPFVLPVTFVRVGQHVYLHGSSKSRLMLLAQRGAPLCFEATLLDGIVLARSAFHHSLNYRSVVVLGRARSVDDPAQKRDVLERLVERLSPGRAAAVRPPTELELRATAVLDLPLDEASAKVRSGGPKDDPEDLNLPCWAGVLPLHLLSGKPVPAADLTNRADVPEPSAALEIRRSGPLF